MHIVFGDSAAGLLKYYFHKNKNEFKGEIINLRNDYSIGPIHEIETDAGFRKRKEWFKKMLKEVWAYEYYEEFEEEFINTYESVKNIESDSKIVIWYGKNASDEIGIRYLSSLLEDRELYQVNISESYVKSYGGNSYKPRAFGECDPEEINHLILTMKKIEMEKCKDLINQWEIIKNSKENLRILQDNKIVGVDENYYDNEILSNCSFNFKKAPRIIGATMGKAQQLVSDSYIDYRVRRLIESGIVEYRGKLETMRDFEIRVQGSLNEFFIKLFEKSCEKDKDGFYHYLLETKENDLVVDTTHITKWDTSDLYNKLILDYDEENMFSLTWFKEGIDIIRINHTLVDNIEYRTQVYNDENSKEIKEETIMIFLESLWDKYIEIQIKPYIKIVLKNL